MNSQLVVKHIRTKNKVRRIVTYREHGELRKYHELVVDYLTDNVMASKFAKAYTPRSSIYKNAEAHLYNDIFLKLDIKDFFSTINHNYLAERLYFEINKNSRISRKECYDIVRKCSVGNKGLPLGLVTSPILANIYLKEFDGLLYGKIKKIGVINPIYTRYADDITISFKTMVEYEEKIEKIKEEVVMLLHKIHLSVNVKKTSVVNLVHSNHVRITGISITKGENNYRHISVGKKLKNYIFWEALNLYDGKKEKTKTNVLHLKGSFSFVLSIEKQGIDNIYSEKMKELLRERGFENLKNLIDTLDYKC